ncbi:MAG: iron ABC transporter permease [Candidatus Methanomethylophilaceae archaeon]|nr:iron ABC transporter permease [Candidatus Methanomethylophilaceae archaeon]
MSEEASGEDFRDRYSHYVALKILFIAFFALATFFIFWVSLCVGTRDLDVATVFDYFIKHLQGVTYEPRTQEFFDDSIVWNYRVPRALFGIVSGAGLAIAGAIMQSVMKNPLADPYTTGVSSGALFGVAIAMTLGFTFGGQGLSGVGTVANAILMSMVPVVVIILFSPFFRKSPSTLILAGVAVSYLFNALTSILLVSTDEENLATVYRWQVGSFTDLSWGSLPLMTIAVVVGIAIILPLSNKLNLMSLDDKDAKSLGLNSEKLRILCLVILSFIAASIVSYVGIIGFVGLVIPHMVRMVIGSDNRYLIPGSVVLGAFFLTACDIISRALDVQAEVPVGVVTSFIGAPIFLYLIIRQKSGVW